MNANAGMIAIIGGVLWLVYQYFKNKYFIANAAKATKAETPVVTAIAADTQKAADDTQALKGAEDALDAALNADAKPSPGSK